MSIAYYLCYSRIWIMVGSVFADCIKDIGYCERKPITFSSCRLCVFNFQLKLNLCLYGVAINKCFLKCRLSNVSNFPLGASPASVSIYSGSARMWNVTCATTGKRV